MTPASEFEFEMTPSELWDLVGCCFSEDDGSLPGIEIRNLAPDEVAHIYAWIRSNSVVASLAPAFWDNREEVDRPIDSVPNAALLVATGQAAPFLVAVNGLTVDRVTIPCLGIFVFQDTIALDYRMGSAWQPEQVFAFFSLLRHLVLFSAAGTIHPASNEGPPYPEAFAVSWACFLNSFDPPTKL